MFFRDKKSNRIKRIKNYSSTLKWLHKIVIIVGLTATASGILSRLFWIVKK